MAYYIFIENGQLNGAGEALQLTEGVENIEITKEVYNAYVKNPEMYVYQDGEVVIDPEYEEKQAQKERNRLDMLNLTGADVERGIYQAKGMDFEDIIALVTQLQPAGLDIKALKIELKANNFYRGNPYVNVVGTLLGFTTEQLDKFFEFNDYTYLLPVEKPVEPESTEELTEIPMEDIEPIVDENITA